MTTFAHFSDLHFGRGVTAVIDGLLESLHQATPDLIIISGDLTQRARASQFQKAERFLNRLPCPFLIVPGNHDLPPLQSVQTVPPPLGKLDPFCFH
ncbi:metallophosphoesterase [Desulfosarcina variabilis str. Montpellier]|uniref:metallophosphoesterase family protein n=1 Tax=Desulfosarcina variabilis TaxID=2300 RepID=UPI003AFA2829